MIDLQQLRQDTRTAIEGILEVAKLEAGEIFVVGCSTSEVAGERIGTSGSIEIAETLFAEIAKPLKERGIHLAIQCCEHLNRALVVEKEVAKNYFLEQVTVIPHEKAGGSLATQAYKKFKKPVLVETIQGHAGMDIGDTLIGMHFKKVVVPVRLNVQSLGNAHVTFARTRPKLIGGERAKYCL